MRRWSIASLRDPHVPRLRFRRTTTVEWVTTYKRKGIKPIKVTTIGKRPPKQRKFKVAGGIKLFKAVSIQHHQKEVLIMAKAAKKTKDKDEVLTDEELEALAAEDIEALDDADDVEAEDDAPASTKSSGSKKDKKNKKGKKGKAPAPRRSRTSDGKVGTAEVAERTGVDARTVRMVLRKYSIPKDDETGRYEWDEGSKDLKKLLKLLEEGEADKVKKEGLDRLKEQQAAKREAKKAEKGKKDKKKGKKSKKSDEDDE